MKNNQQMKEQRNELYKTSQSLSSSEQDVLIILGNCLLTKQKMDMEKSAV